MTDSSDPKWRRFRREDIVDLDSLSIPLGQCVCVAPGPIDPAVLAKLEERGFDQAPVCDGKGTYGLVETHHLRSLLEVGLPLNGDDAGVRDEEREFCIPTGGASLFAILAKMISQRAILVIRSGDAGEYGLHTQVKGLLTISDLNRQAFRSAIYRLLADVESGLAKWLEMRAGDPWDWLKHLDEEQQARVLGYWELSKREGVDVGPIAALTLAQLINIVSRHETAAEHLGYPSRTQFGKAAGRLPSLRNRIMHPVRPLILAQRDVAKVSKAVDVLDDLREKLERFVDDTPRV